MRFCTFGGGAGVERRGTSTNSNGMGVLEGARLGSEVRQGGGMLLDASASSDEGGSGSSLAKRSCSSTSEMSESRLELSARVRLPS